MFCSSKFKARNAESEGWTMSETESGGERGKDENTKLYYLIIGI
jgi:hypothetical protein